VADTPISSPAAGLGAAPALRPDPQSGQDHPSGDNRFKMLDASMKRHRFAPEALIEVLHTAQELFGYLTADILYYIAHHLRLPPSRVYGVATFYHFFTFAPKGEHSGVVCTGTACYVKGADRILAVIEGALGTVAGRVAHRFGSKTALVVGAGVSAMSFAWLYVAHRHPYDFLVGAFLLGFLLQWLLSRGHETHRRRWLREK